MRYDLDHLRGHQPELVDVVEKDLTPYYKNRGVTITSLGMVGGLTPTNPKIQAAIDQTIQDQQLKVSAKARSEAQEQQNEQIKLAAEGKKAALIIEAAGKAEAIKKMADAKAYEIKQVIQDKQLYLSLQKLEMSVIDSPVGTGSIRNITCPAATPAPCSRCRRPPNLPRNDGGCE